MEDHDPILKGLRAALAEARQHEGATAPNPAVGCALLDAAGEILCTGAHVGPGRPHAEAAALARAEAEGLTSAIHTVVVTLEPCNHHGRTGPCSKAILKSPAKAVWYALPDPNPEASGGAARLTAAGVPARQILGTAPVLAEVQRLTAPFLTRVTKGRPFLTVKQALDAQGSMIPPKGAKTFTGPAALLLAHALRRRADAIVTGSGTVLADRPEFTVRHLPDIAGKTRALAILDRRGRVDEGYLHSARAKGFDPFIAQDLDAALAELAARGCNEALVEAGPSLLATLEARGLWDEWVRIDHIPGQTDRITITSH
jgi:diaminohydroxyphosphoribosylaminopyrimidine deaminase/5-amino-6-(5-phosphoribosylamino)uracil reductase